MVAAAASFGTDILTEDEARGAVAAAGQAAWIIDPAAARILAANGAAAAILGPDRAILDVAMPALARLRGYAKSAKGSGPVAAASERLVLWGPRGSYVLSCTLEPVAARDGAPAVLVTAAAPMSSSPTAVDEPARPMDDAAKLREIARRIRQGSAAAAPGAGDKPVTTHAHDGQAREPVEDGPADVVGKGSESIPPPRRPLQGLPRGLIAELAHELKTPLSAIAAAAEIMKDERLGTISNQRYIGYAADIHEGAKHALAVIERLLSSAATGEPAADPLSPVDLAHVARSCLSSIAPLASAKAIVLSAEISTKPLLVQADATGLRQIILNLLTNAMKFCSSGNEVCLSAKRRAAGGATLVVRDNGPGMSESELSAVRRAYTPEQRDAPREGGGWGLGLPLVNKLARAQGAHFELESAPGKGTTASLTFAPERSIPTPALRG